jgi:hypothetical protein
LLEGARERAPSLLLGGCIAAVLVLAACDAGTTPVPTSKVNQLTLTEQDLPGFLAFYKGPQVQLDNQGTNRTNASRFGREGGSIIRLHPADSTQTNGALVIESRADLFKDSDGAKSDFALYQALLKRPTGSGVSQISIPGLTQDSIGVTFTEAGGRTLRFFRIAWRDRNVTAAITVEGFDGSVSQDQAIALAKKQENHIKGA